MVHFEKEVMMLNWIARQCYGKTVDKLDALKQVYLADRYHLRRFGRLITGDSYYTMRLGPVPSMAKNICTGDRLTKDQALFTGRYLSVDGDSIHSRKTSSTKYFTESELEALNASRIKALMAVQQGETLPEFTHHFPEWIKYAQKLTKDTSRCKIDLLDFFEPAGVFEYCPASERLIQSNKSKFQEDRAMEALIDSCK